MNFSGKVQLEKYVVSKLIKQGQAAIDLENNTSTVLKSEDSISSNFSRVLIYRGAGVDRKLRVERLNIPVRSV